MFQTAGEPPSWGRTSLAIIGSIMKTMAAPQKAARTNRLSLRERVPRPPVSMVVAVIKIPSLAMTGWTTGTLGLINDVRTASAG